MKIRSRSGGLTVNDLWNTLACHVDLQIRSLRRLVGILHPHKALDLPSTRPCVNSLAVCLFTVFDRSRYVHQEEISPCATRVHDSVFGDLSRMFLRRDGGDDYRGSCSCELCSDKGQILGMLVSFLSCEALLYTSRFELLNSWRTRWYRKTNLMGRHVGALLRVGGRRSALLVRSA